MSYMVNNCSYGYKAEAVKAVMKANTSISKKFRDMGANDEWIASLNNKNADDYGPNGRGEMCDKILRAAGTLFL